MKRTIESEFIVVGGGVIGASIAWGLTRLGRKVLVADEGDIAVRPSRGNFSLIWVQSKGLGMVPYGFWAKRAAELWPAFAGELEAASGIELGFIQPGGVHLVLSEQELAVRANTFVRLRQQAGVDIYPHEMLDRATVKKMLPDIGPEVAGASYCPLDGQVNPLRLLMALHTAMIRGGTTYLPEQKVADITYVGEEFQLQTPDFLLVSKKLVLAAGHDNVRLAPMVGLQAPVRPQRGQIMITEKVRPFLAYPTINVRQTDEGGVQIGDSMEEVGFDQGLDLGVLSTIAQRTSRMFPLLRRLNVVRAWGALRVMPKDGYPIYDQSRQCPEAFLATAHSGVSMSPSHALDLARMIDQGALGPEISSLSARRFDVPAAA